MQGETLRLLRLFSFSQPGMEIALALVVVIGVCILSFAGAEVNLFGVSAWFESTNIVSLSMTLTVILVSLVAASKTGLDLWYTRDPMMIPGIPMEFPYELIYVWYVLALGSFLGLVWWAGNNVRNRQLGLSGLQIRWEKDNPVNITAPHLTAGVNPEENACLSAWGDLPAVLQTYYANRPNQKEEISTYLTNCDDPDPETTKISTYTEQTVSYTSDGVMASGQNYRVDVSVQLDNTGNFNKQVDVQLKTGATWKVVNTVIAYTTGFDTTEAQDKIWTQTDTDTDDGMSINSDGLVMIYIDLPDGTVLKIRLDDNMHLPTDDEEVDPDGSITFKLIPSKAAMKPLKLTIKALVDTFAQPYQDVIDFESV
uniref:Uncharacterized protein n=1 Tax=viral metagenome TaxID=1070528 RepID=A0A6C0KBI6_9ZZZZ